MIDRPLPHQMEVSQRAYDGIACGVIVWNDAGLISYCNAAAQRILRLNEGTLLGRASLADCGLTLIGEDGVELPASLALAPGIGGSGHERAIKITRPGSEPRWILGDTVDRPATEVAPASSVYSFVDITDRKYTEEALAYQSLHDPLTSLPNRILLMDRMIQALTYAERHGGRVALLLVDLDRFKDVNDSFGHHVGDLLLLEIGARLHHSLRACDTVARLGGDEFAIVLPDQDDSDSAKSVAEKLLEVIQAPFQLGGDMFDVSGSIGVAMYPDHGLDAETLLRRADIAMYVAKSNHGGVSIYSRRQDPRSAQRVRMTSELRQALRSDQLVLHYQPVVWAAPRDHVMVEALVRWQHPSRGLLLPNNFLSFVEQVGLMPELTTWVLTTAFRQCRAWHEAGFPVHVAVNLAMSTLHDEAFPSLLQSLLTRCGIVAKWVKLEVTETAVMRHPASVLRILAELRDMGFQLSVDDFGTGYSSLTYLRRMPVHELKIDRSFVREMAENSADDVIIRSTIELGHNLGLAVIAEGVEDREVWERLNVMGCDAVQGYYAARPMPAGELAGWLTSSAERWSAA